MRRCLALALLPTLASAQDRVEWPPSILSRGPAYVEIERHPDDPTIWRVEFHNEYVHSGDERFTLDMAGEPVGIVLGFNVDRLGAESLTVTAPPGWFAYPERVVVREGATAEILLIQETAAIM